MLKHVILLNGHRPKHFPDTFARTAEARGVTSENIETERCIISVGYDGSTVVVSDNRILPTSDTGYLIKSTGGDTYRTYLIGRILEMASPVFVDETNILSDKSSDKITMTALLPLFDIKVPRSIIATTESYRINHEYIMSHVAFPAVVKKAGSKGKQVWKVANQAEMEDCLQQDGELSLIQEYIENEHDFRVFVLDGQVIAAIKRSSADGFYNNVSQGGAAMKAEMTAEEKDICIRAAAAAKLRIAGVDLVRTPNGPLIFEVNKAPQMDIFHQAAGFDIETTYSERVLEELTRLSK